jgi:hypothetical protein
MTADEALIEVVPTGFKGYRVTAARCPDTASI